MNDGVKGKKVDGKGVVDNNYAMGRLKRISLISRDCRDKLKNITGNLASLGATI
jgi:hypothetical protein